MKRKNVRIPFLMLLLSPLLISCDQVAFEPVSPDLIEYDLAFQKQAANELSTMKPPCAHDVIGDQCSAVHRMIVDYGGIRGQIRAIANQ